MNNTIHHDVAQNSADWFELRLGRITASSMDKIADGFTKKGELKKETNDYINQLVLERLTRQKATAEKFMSAYAIEWGRDHERDAVNALAAVIGQNIETCGIYEHKELSMLASPDGVFINDEFDAIPIEVKCPYNSHNHIDNFVSGSLFERYSWQVHTQIIVFNAPYGYFASYDPRLPEKSRLHVRKVMRCPRIEQTIRAAVVATELIIAERLDALQNGNGFVATVNNGDKDG